MKTLFFPMFMRKIGQFLAFASLVGVLSSLFWFNIDPIQIIAAYYLENVSRSRLFIDIALTITIASSTISARRIITKLRDGEKARKELGTSENNFRALFETAMDGLFLADLNGYIVDCNQTAHMRLGYTKNEMLGKHMSQFVSPRFVDSISKRIGKINQDGYIRFESEHICKDRTLMPVDVNIQYIFLNGKQRLFSINRDITQSKKIEMDLKESRQRLGKILENAPIGMGICDKEGRLLFVNNSLCSMLGYSKLEAEQLSIWEITHPSEWEKIDQSLIELFESRIKSISENKRFVTKYGDIVHARVSSSVHKDTSGNLVHIAQIENLTDFKKAEEKLNDSENLYGLLFETAKDTLVILDLYGVILDINPSGYSRLGYTKEEMVGKHIKEFISPQCTNKLKNRIEQLLDEGTIAFDSENICKDGSLIPIEVNCRIIDLHGRKRLFAINRDISERKKREENMRRREALSRAVIERILDC